MFITLPSPSSISPPILADRKVRIISDGRNLSLLAKADLWIEAAGNYVRFWVDDSPRPYLVRDTVLSMHNRLDQAVFVRIRQSMFVNRHRIRELRPWYAGEYIVTPNSGKELTLSRGYRRNLPDLLAIAEHSVTSDKLFGAIPQERGVQDRGRALAELRSDISEGRSSL